MPEQADMEEIMYRLYVRLFVIDKIRKGRQAADQGDMTSIDELKKEIKKW